jgi:hypothetical protein
VWVIAAAVAVSELARYVGYLALARRVLGLSLAEIARAHVPAAFASAGVALAVGATAFTLADSAPALVVLGAEIAAGAAALGVCIRCCPTPAVRTELWSRLGAAGLIGPTGGVRERVPGSCSDASYRWGSTDDGDAGPDAGPGGRRPGTGNLR